MAKCLFSHQSSAMCIYSFCFFSLSFKVYIVYYIMIYLASQGHGYSEGRGSGDEGKIIVTVVK